MAPARGPVYPGSHAKAQHLRHPWIPGLPRARLRPPAAAVPSRPGAPQGRRRAVTPQNAHGGHHPEWVPPLPRTEAPFRPFAPQRGPGSPHTLGMQGGTPEQRPETRNPSRSRRRSRKPPPAARRVVFLEDTDREHRGPNDLHTQRASSTTDPRRRSKRPRTERAHIPTIPTSAERERQAQLHTGPRRAADGASSSSATSLPGSAASPLRGGQHATDKQPRKPAASQVPVQGMGGQCPEPPLLRERGAMTPVPNRGTGHPTNRARAPRGSQPQLQHSPTARARRAHRNNRSTARAAQGRTRK